MITENTKAAANALAISLDADVIVFNAPVERGSDRKIIALCSAMERKRRNAFLLLVTEGGDPDVAYRISRAIQNNYKEGTFYCFISGFCKSAGTLLALGAHELVFSDHGEVGPIDVQMGKKDELWEWQSGLTVNASLSSLNEQAFQAFESFLVQTKYHLRGGITLRTASEVAAKLATGLYAPIFEQFDPMHIGEAGRSVLIAQQYALRLDMRARNLKKDTLKNLIMGYPSHGFVIDQEEAVTMFNRVRPASPLETALEKSLGDASCIPIDSSKQSIIVEFVSTEIPEESANVAGPVLNPPAEHGIGDFVAPPAGDVPGDGAPPAVA